ncbi:hypothetical protein BQ8482_280129 [Mesorhizobium delmotii]|uniref:Uncharacterized protein n=1 Tax=Mesorhizobium delmotii TaxID=1631247 RepID=A0A2P9AMN7_9HYPH|nr:hypothetical protein BQ8482_280129 [Mesorhizobium delmotii]
MPTRAPIKNSMVTATVFDTRIARRQITDEQEGHAGRKRRYDDQGSRDPHVRHRPVTY